MADKTRAGNGKPTNDVAKQEANLPAKLDYGDDFGSGYEGMSQEDFSIPFLTVLQGLSPQVAGENPIEGAQVGKLFNTVSEEMWDGKTGLIFVPACREHCFIEWLPRDQGGGYVGRHEVGSEIVTRAKQTAEQRNKLKTEAGNDLIETFYLYGMAIDNVGDPAPVVIAFTSTKIKAYRHLMTRLNQVTVGEKKQRPPLFANQVCITTVMEKNTKGTFANFKFSPAKETFKSSLLAPDDDLLALARGLKDVVHSGVAKINPEGGGTPGADPEQEEPPF